MSFQKFFYINGNDNEFWIESGEDKRVFKPFNSTIKFNFYIPKGNNPIIRSSLDFDLDNKNKVIKSTFGTCWFDEISVFSNSINIFGNETMLLNPKINFLQASNSDQENTSSFVIKRQKNGDKYGPPDGCIYIFLDNETFHKIDNTIKNKINFNIELGIDFLNYEGIYLNSDQTNSSNSIIHKYCILEKFEDIENYSKYENLRSFFKTNSNCNNKEDNIIKLVHLKINYSDRNYKKEYLQKLNQIESNIQQLSNNINSLNQTLIDKEISSKD